MTNKEQPSILSATFDLECAAREHNLKNKIDAARLAQIEAINLRLERKEKINYLSGPQNPSSRKT